jgi:hypothetical protein
LMGESREGGRKGNERGRGGGSGGEVAALLLGLQR